MVYYLVSVRICYFTEETIGFNTTKPGYPTEALMGILENRSPQADHHFTNEWMGSQISTIIRQGRTSDQIYPWASCQIRKTVGCACSGNAGSVFAATVSDPDMHYGTCEMHVPWCMPGLLISKFPWSQWRRKRSRHSRLMRNPQFYVSGKRSMPWCKSGTNE